MKKLIALTSLISISIFSYGQNTDLKDLVVGTISIMPSNVPSYFYKKIMIIDNATKNEFEKTAVVMSVKKDGSTVLGVKMNENLIYVAGYAPVTKNGIFTGEGEFYLYKKENAQTTLVTHIFKTLRRDTSNNKENEYLENSEWDAEKIPDYVIMILDKFEIQFMAFKGYTFLLPPNYFDYK